MSRRVAFGLLLLLAALLPVRVEASRTSVWESNPPSSLTATNTDAAGLLASLAPADATDVDAAELPPFNLGDIILADTAAADAEHFDLGPLTLVDLNLLRGPPPSYPETRVGGFELLPPFRVGASPRLSLWPRQACGFSCREVASDSRQDPWGLSWTTFAYGVAEGAINLALGTAQMMARPYLPAPLNNVNVSVNLTQPGKPVASASVPTVTEQLKSASTVIPVGEMLGRFTANLGLTVAGWFDPTASQEYLDEVHSDLGRDTPGTAMVVAPLALKGGAAARAAIERRVPAFENPYTPEGLAGNPLLEGSSPAVTPKITLQQRGGNHHQIVRSIANQLTDQGYVVKGNGARFYDANGVTYTQTDLFAVRPTGDPMVLELKTGNAVTTPNQNLVYPQIMSGDALPSRSVARLLGIRPGIPLKDQGFPNGIPVYQVSAPGL